MFCGLQGAENRIRGFLSASCLCLLAFLSLGTIATAAPQSESEFTKMRHNMVEVAVKGAGVTDARVLNSMSATPRHEFVPKNLRRTRSR